MARYRHQVCRYVRTYVTFNSYVIILSCLSISCSLASCLSASFTLCLQILGKEMDATPNPGMLSATPIPLASAPVEQPVSDLFSAHDFDIQIDLPSPDDGKLLRYKYLINLISHTEG